ncbi:MAG: sensor histidine kinase [Chitinophagaceae bacterium]
MSIAESTRTETKDSYSQLFLIYDIQTKEVLFSNLPVEDFLGPSLDLTGHFPFQNKEQSKITNLANEWQYCLQLKEKETRNFHFQASSTRGKAIHFIVDAVGINMPAHLNSPVILFSIKKDTTQDNSTGQNKTELIHQKDYAEFIDLAAHDLDAPLRKLSLLIERLTHKYQTEPASDMQGYFTRIQSSITDMRTLVDSLSRLSGLSLAPTINMACDINAIVKEVLVDLQQTARGKNVSATVAALPVLNGDLIQYRQLFQNLLQNALRFSKTDSPLQIKISAVPLSTGEKTSLQLQGNKNWFRITVADNGIGFKQEYAEKIFKPFVRLHGKSEYPGTGMGLAICKKITDNHGGFIYAEGKEAEGATFTLILPQSL